MNCLSRIYKTPSSTHLGYTTHFALKQEYHRYTSTRCSRCLLITMAGSSAAQKVFNITELAELILSFLPQKDLLQEISRHGTPLQNLDESVSNQSVPLSNQADNLAALPTSAALENTVQNSTSRPERSGPGPARRARSATMMELGPYPQKSHSCPIPSCGRLFKRLEHLKR